MIRGLGSMIKGLKLFIFIRKSSSRAKRIFAGMQYRFVVLILIVFLLPFAAVTQQTDTLDRMVVISPANSLPSAEDIAAKPNKKRVAWVAGVNIAVVGGSLVLLNEAWYKNEPRSSFHFFDDSREWMQLDKFGHTWSAYNAARAVSSMWRWTGLSRKKAALFGSLTSYTYMTGIELLDGFAEKWGWSWSDVAANTVGIGLYLSQELAWQEQRIQYKFSFHSNRYRDPVLSARVDDLFGNGLYERVLKDYNAQTYWFSANIRSFFPDSKWPSWLNLAVGYGAAGMYGGFENKWETGQGITIDRTDIPRTRQFYFAPDIDFTRIRTKSKFLKTTFSILNAFKFPAPTFMIDGKGKARVYAVYF